MSWINRNGNFKCECKRTFGTKRALNVHLKSYIHKDLMNGMPDFTDRKQEEAWCRQKRAERMSREEGKPLDECIAIVQENIRQLHEAIERGSNIIKSLVEELKIRTMRINQKEEA